MHLKVTHLFKSKIIKIFKEMLYILESRKTETMLQPCSIQKKPDIVLSTGVRATI